MDEQKIADFVAKAVGAKFDAKFDELTKRIQKSNDDYKKEIKQLLNVHSSEIASISTKVTKLETKVDEKADIAARINRLTLNGVPFKDNENLQEIFEALSSHLGYTRPVDAQVFRFKSADMSKQPIIIRFATEFHKDEYIARFSKANQITRKILPGFGNDNTKVYIQHDLTKSQYNINKVASQLIKDGIVKKRTLRQGRVNIKFEPNGNFYAFDSVEELDAEVDKYKSMQINKNKSN